MWSSAPPAAAAPQQQQQQQQPQQQQQMYPSQNGAAPSGPGLAVSFVSKESSQGSKAARKKAAKGAMPTWQCALCTFNNKLTRDCCEMCEMPNPRASDPASKQTAASAAANGIKKGAASAAAAAAAGAAAAAPAPALSSVSASFRAGAYENGLITACNNLTYDEVMRRRLIGLPRAQADLVNKLRSKTSAIFLLNMESREMFGVFEADGAPGLDLEPEAWAGSGFNGRRTSRFPAQCHFTIAADFETPLSERHYRDLLFKEKRDKIRVLSGEETRQLIKLFQAKSKLRKLPTPPAASAAPSVASGATSRRTSIDSTVSEDDKKKGAGGVAGAALAGKKGAKAQQTCKRWLADECAFSADECKFLHVATVCRAFQRGTCPKKNCPFVHDKVDREHYRHGRSYCQKTAVHADDKSVAGNAPVAAAAASSSSASAAASGAKAKKDSLDSILSGLGQWKLGGKKASEQPEPEPEPLDDNIDEDDAEAMAELDAAAAAAADAELEAAQDAADAELLAQQDAAQEHRMGGDDALPSGLSFDLGGGLSFDHAPSAAQAAPAGPHALFMDGGLSFDMPASSGSQQGSGAPGGGPSGGWSQFDSAGFEQGGGGGGVPNQPSGVAGSPGIDSHFQAQEGSMFFSQPAGDAQFAQQQQQQQEEFAWFTNFRQHVVAPALQALHVREQQTQHKLIGPD